MGSVTRFGVSTVQPGEDATALPDQVDHADVTRIVVTRSDGTLVGLFFAADVTPASVTEAVVGKELTACVAMDSGQRRELIRRECSYWAIQSKTLLRSPGCGPS